MITLYEFTNSRGQEFVFYKHNKKNSINTVFVTGDVFGWSKDKWVVNENGEIYQYFNFDEVDRKGIDFTRILNVNT